ncbi:MAG: PEGA domain-containing protein [Deltaproteobacteria bacterium]|nr:PEGA domain-containing protein [Deltaproteobacteria bacterium]
MISIKRGFAIFIFLALATVKSQHAVTRECFSIANSKIYITTTPKSSKLILAETAKTFPEKVEPKKKLSIAVLELSGLGISDITKNLEQYLRNSLATIEGIIIISQIDIQMAMQDPRNRTIAQCGGRLDCAFKIGKLVSADVVILGSISGLGNSYSINLRALDVANKKEISRYQASVSGRNQLIPEIRLAAYKLVAPDKIKGWLIIDIKTKGMTIEIDGVLIGTTPFTDPIDSLSPGKHKVIIRRSGYAPHAQEIIIRPFESTKLTLTVQTK